MDFGFLLECDIRIIPAPSQKGMEEHPAFPSVGNRKLHEEFVELDT
jgi:hypothetical protein